jgi:hypothetical protein
MRTDRISAIFVICALVFFAGCEKVDSEPKLPGSGSSGGSSTVKPGDPISVGEAVSVSIELDKESPKPKERVRMTLTVKNGLLDDVEDVKAKIQSNPANVDITDRQMLKTVDTTLKNGEDGDVKWSMTVKDRGEFVPDNNPEVIKVRTSYSTSVHAATKFAIADTPDGGTREKASTTSSIVPVTIEVDPSIVPLDKDEEVVIDIKVLKGADATSGVLLDSIDRIEIEIPDAGDFDTPTCTYEDQAETKTCTMSSGIIALEDVKFHSEELSVHIVLPMKESSLNEMRGTERLVRVGINEIKLYKDATVSLKYDLSD